jgi:hypothetical protein
MSAEQTSRPGLVNQLLDVFFASDAFQQEIFQAKNIVALLNIKRDLFQFFVQGVAFVE